MSEITPSQLRRGYGPIYRKFSRCGNELSVPAKLVLFNLMERQGQNSSAWPAQPQIAIDTGMSARSVWGALQELKGLGFVEQGKKAGANNNLNEYSIELEALIYWAEHPHRLRDRLAPDAKPSRTTCETVSQDVRDPSIRRYTQEDHKRRSPSEGREAAVSARKKLTFKPLTSEQRLAIVSEFAVIPNVSEEIDYALSHTAAQNATDHNLYVRRWLRRNLNERSNGNGNSRTGAAHHAAGGVGHPDPLAKLRQSGRFHTDG